jgi:8-oxo-dGTP diphosphatase
MTSVLAERFCRARSITKITLRAILRGASNSAFVFKRIHLCTGLLERAGRVLLVASAYPNHAELLWNLPGGRQEWGETCAQTVARELREETSLEVRVGALAYVAESFDAASETQFTAFCFAIEAEGEPVVPLTDPSARACRWVAIGDLAAALAVRVVREPLVAHLADRSQRYFGYLEAGITIAFAGEPASPSAAIPNA